MLFGAIGVGNRPASRIFASGSPALTPWRKTRSRSKYSLAFGVASQKFDELTSFQSCHQITGSRGISGCVTQKVPSAP